LKWDYLWASLCIVGAVFFIFRERGFNDAPIAMTSTDVSQVEKKP
jgi:hypothetical protein